MRCASCHEVHLQPEREIADFIEQQSAPARGFERSVRRCRRAFRGGAIAE